MLRESSTATGESYDLTAIVGSGGADGGVPNGMVLVAFVDAVLGSDEGQCSDLRDNVRHAVGDAGFVDVCATIASFNAVVKLADGTGIPLEDWKENRTRDIRDALSIDAFRA
ncbi:MAG: hypothetical protein HC868_09895 [Sphingomonadales bacterium]|nr:hypothetical protein [Sphingomonadales bacterium]